MQQQKYMYATKKILMQQKYMYTIKNICMHYMDNKRLLRATKICMRQYIQQYAFTHAVLVQPIYWCAI